MKILEVSPTSYPNPNIKGVMMGNRLVSWLSIFILIGTTSCASQGKAETLPGVAIPLADYNTKFVMILYPGTLNSIKNGDSVGFILHNQSSSSIIFPNDFGTKIFEKQAQGWKLVENQVEYPDIQYLLETSIVNPGGLVFEIAPFDPNLKATATIRIVVIGHVQDKPDEEVGADIDMEINP